MEIKKFVENFYDEETEYTFVKTESDVYEFTLSQEAGSMRDYASAKKNGVKVADTWNEVVHLYHSLGCSKIEAEMSFCREAHLDDEDEAAAEAFDAAVIAAKKWLYPEEAAAEEEAAQIAAKEEAAKKAARKAAEEEATQKAAEEEAARLATYGDEQDIAVLEVLYKALQQSKKPKAIINYASRFCPRFKSGRFEQPRTIIRAGGREYAFQPGIGWERII